MPPDLSRDSTRERGHAGAAGSSSDLFSELFGDIFEDTEELQWPNSVVTYNRMRRQSAQIAAVNRAWQLPVNATPWYVQQGPARREVAVQLARDLGLPMLEESGEISEETRPTRRRGRFSWKEHVKLALLSKVFGHMVFEQVYEYRTRAQGGDGLAHLKKLAPRMPQTIARWDVARDGGLNAIEQHQPWGADGPVGDPIRLKINELVVYVHEKEGANWWGTSILRPVYMPYMAKDRLYRLGLATAERAMGHAIYEASDGAGQDELDRGLDLAKAMRTGEEAASAVPHGASLYYGGVKGTLYDPLSMIQHLSVLESRNMMAQFLNLGDTETGSRALGEVFVDFFTLALQSVLEDVQDTAQLHVVEDWVDVNYGEAEPAPEVVPGDVGGRPAVMAEALVNLMGNGAVTYDEELEDWVRRGLGAPARSDRGRQALPPAGGTGGTPPERTPTPPGPAPEATALASKPFAERDYRAPTDQEQLARTDFARLDSTYQRLLRRGLDAWRKVQAEQIQALLEAVKEAVEGGSIAALGALAPPTTSAKRELRALLDDMVSESVDEAVREARRQGVAMRRPDIRALRKAVQGQADAMAEVMAQGLGEKVSREAIRNAAGANLTSKEVADRVSGSLDDLTDSYLLDMLGGALITAQNTGRARVFELSGPGRYYASELLDGATCTNCSSVDGTEYDSLEAALAAYPSGGYHQCLGGYRCRGTVVKVHDEAIPSEEAA